MRKGVWPLLLRPTSRWRGRLQPAQACLLARGGGGGSPGSLPCAEATGLQGQRWLEMLTGG